MSDRVTIASVDDLEPGDATTVEVDGEPIALFNVDGDFYAVDNTCTHMGGPLGGGTLSGTTVTCPLHGARFDVTSGEVLGPPASDPVRPYEVVVEGTDVVMVR